MARLSTFFFHFTSSGCIHFSYLKPINQGGSSHPDHTLDRCVCLPFFLPDSALPPASVLPCCLASRQSQRKPRPTKILLPVSIASWRS